MSTPSNFKTNNESNKSEVIIKVKVQRKRVIWFLVVSAVLIPACYFFSDNALNLYQKYLVNDHQEVVSYIDTIDHYNSDGNELIINARLKLYRMTSEEYSSQIQKSKSTLKQLIADTTTLKAPAGFSQYKKSILTVMTQRMVVLDNYEETRKTTQYDMLNKGISDLNLQEEATRKILMESLNKAGIKYKVLGDGSFRYFYKSHSAKSIN